MRKYKYDGKDYDFDAYKKLAIDNFESWASERNLGSTRTEKIRQAMLELLQHMTDDEGSKADLRRISFSTEYANNKGIFGKNVKNSKHYLNATSYLLGQFSSSKPYEEPKPEEKPKTKVTRLWLGQQLTDALGNVSSYTDEQKRTESARAFNLVLSRLSGADTDYEVEEGYDLPTFRNWLQEGATAAGTNDNFVDDNIYWGRLGITNPFYKAPVATKPESAAEETAGQKWLKGLGLSRLTSDLEQYLLNLYNNNVLSKVPGFKEEDFRSPSTVREAPVKKSSTGVISYNRLNAGHIYNSGGLSDFNQLPAFRKTYTDLVVPLLKNGTWATGKVTHNNITYDTRDLLGAMVNLSLISDSTKASLGLVKVKRKGQKNGDLYIITKSYNPKNLTAVYYNARTANFSTGKADLDFVHWANNPNNKSYLKEGGILKFQSGRTIDSPEILHGFGVIDMDSLDKVMPDTITGVNYTPAGAVSPGNSAQEQQKEETKKGSNGLLQTLEVATGLASLFPVIGYPAGIISSGLGLWDTWTTPGLSTAEKWGRTGVDLLGFIPGGTYARAGKMAGRLIKGTEAVTDAAKITRETKKALKTAENSKKAAEEALKGLGKEGDRALKKQYRAQLRQANQDIATHTKKLEELKASTTTIDLPWKAYAKAQGTRMAITLPTAGALQYGIPGMAQANDDENAGVLDYATKGFRNFGGDLVKAANGDATAASNLWHLTAGTMHIGTKGPHRLPTTRTTTTAATAATATAASAKKNDQPIQGSGLGSHKPIVNETPAPVTQMKYEELPVKMSGAFGFNIPKAAYDQAVKTGDWSAVNNGMELINNAKVGEHGILMYSPDNKPYYVHGIGGGKVSVRNSAGKEVGVVNSSDLGSEWKMYEVGLYPKMDWYTNHPNTFTTPIMQRKTKQFYQRFPNRKLGGKLNNLKNLRK